MRGVLSISCRKAGHWGGVCPMPAPGSLATWTNVPARAQDPASTSRRRPWPRVPWGLDQMKGVVNWGIEGPPGPPGWRRGYSICPGLVAWSELVVEQVTCGWGDKAATDFSICLFITAFIHSLFQPVTHAFTPSVSSPPTVGLS